MKRKELWSQRESSVLWHLIQKNPVPPLLREEQKDKHYVRGSILISATERRGEPVAAARKNYTAPEEQLSGQKLGFSHRREGPSLSAVTGLSDVASSSGGEEGQAETSGGRTTSPE